MSVPDPASWRAADRPAASCWAIIWPNGRKGRRWWSWRSARRISTGPGWSMAACWPRSWTPRWATPAAGAPCPGRYRSAVTLSLATSFTGQARSGLAAHHRPQGPERHAHLHLHRRDAGPARRDAGDGAGRVPLPQRQRAAGGCAAPQGVSRSALADGIGPGLQRLGHALAPAARPYRRARRSAQANRSGLTCGASRRRRGSRRGLAARSRSRASTVTRSGPLTSRRGWWKAASRSRPWSSRNERHLQHRRQDPAAARGSEREALLGRDGRSPGTCWTSGWRPGRHGVGAAGARVEPHDAVVEQEAGASGPGACCRTWKAASGSGPPGCRAGRRR